VFGSQTGVPAVIRVTWQLQVFGFFTALHASIDGDVSTETI
jgi:hypothetical protein